MSSAEPSSYAQELVVLGRAAGLDHVGVTTAAPFDRARRALDARAAAGYDGGMQFTYRNPARSTEPRRALAGARALLVGACAYGTGPESGPPMAARVAWYAVEDHYTRLREALGVVADRLRADGWEARVLVDDNALVDREAAWRAGIGWFGKNANLLVPGHGSWFVLGSVLTDAPLPANPEPVADGCGGCSRCLDRCPTGAIVAPGVVDARRCLAWLVQAEGVFPVEHREALGDRIYGCDDCQLVCPVNLRHAGPTGGGTGPAGAGSPERWVDLVELLGSTDEELLARHGRWYIARRDPCSLRRNALVALGNVGRADDPAVVDVVRRHLDHADAIVRAHAVWAARRLALDALVASELADETDPVVVAEIDRARVAVVALVTHLLVTNDFPPRFGGIQSYLWELWRRLPPGEVVVYTTAHPGAAAWDREQPFRIVRSPHGFLRPTPGLARTIDGLADEVDASIVLLDPALPLGIVGRWLRHDYGVVLHGAEVTVPGRLPGLRSALRQVLRGAQLVVAAGGYPAAEGARAAGRSLSTVDIPPGVDVKRFVPLEAEERAAARARFGVAPDALVVLSVSRLVPREGMDVLVAAAGPLRARHPDLLVLVAGTGRQRRALEAEVVASGAPVRFLGAVEDDDLPALYGCADLFVMLCRNRWLGLEQEGFGIVFLEAAAAGVPSVAGHSGGSDEAVLHGRTGLLVADPRSVPAAVAAIDALLADADRRSSVGRAARRRVESDLTYDHLAERLADAVARHARSSS